MEQIQGLIDDLVRKAQLAGGFPFTQTLLRVGGIEDDDPFELFRQEMQSVPTARTVDAETFRRWVRRDDFLAFVWNLVLCTERKPYHVGPLSHLNEGTRYEDLHRVTPAKVAEVGQKLRLAGFPELSERLSQAFPSEMLLVSDGDSQQAVPEDVLANLMAFYQALLSASDRERRAFGESNSFVRWPRFEVLEILAKKDVGLYGYRVYFSNGSHSEFSRTPTRTEALNISFERDGQVNYFLGSIDDLQKEWRVGGKRLFEVGLPGRYNELGTWKPIVYEGDIEPIANEVRGLSDNPDVQGTLFYVHTTAHWVIEFVVGTNVDMPVERALRFGPEEHPLRLWKLVREHTDSAAERLYDGWISLPSPDVDAVETALAHIRIGMSRLAFVYDARLRWRLKYPLVFENAGIATPDKADLDRFDEVLIPPVAAALDLAMGWYNAGRNASDPLTGFLCYFNAIEVVVEGVWEGELEIVDGPLHRQTKAERLEWRRACMEQAYREHFPHDPVRFAQQVYFRCLQQLTKRRRDVLARMWGASHAVVAAVFDPKDGDPSLSEVRNNIAHGKLSALYTDDVRLVKQRIGQVASIAKELILRVLLKKSANDEVKLWSGVHTMAMSTADPRTTMVTNTLSVLPASDWKIRPEWLDP